MTPPGPPTLPPRESLSSDTQPNNPRVRLERRVGQLEIRLRHVEHALVGVVAGIVLVVAAVVTVLLARILP